MPDLLNLEELEALARERLPKEVYDYYAGGAEDEVTVQENRLAFRRINLRYRVLVDVSTRDMDIELLGTRLSIPVILAPTALHRMAHPEGELAVARAAADAGALMCLSSISSVALEEVARAAPEAPRWFQLYHFNDRGRTEELVHRAHAAGYGAIVLTVDAPVLGRRERDLRNPFVIPRGVEAVHFTAAPRPSGAVSPLAAMIDQPALTWEDLAWLRSLSPLPLGIKGVVRSDDAKRAVAEGVDVLWVSNHGGRQLDTSTPTARALPEIVQAVDGAVPVIVDGGIRRGTDVLKALAMGARAVAVGRPQLWALAVGGRDGVGSMLTLLRDELSSAMALAGCRSPADVDASLLA